MYEKYFNLRGQPFQLSPDHRFFFDSRPHRKAFAYLTYGLSKGEGFVVVTGEVGAGKTTLVEYLLSKLRRDQAIVAKVVTTQLEAENLVRMVAAAFGIQQEGLDKATVLMRLEAFLTDCYRNKRRPLLIIDEVQNLSHDSLEELRMLSNFQVDARPLLQTFLVGQPQFRAKIASRDLEQLRQRVIAYYHLTPLDPDEARDYIEHRLVKVGWKDNPHFNEEAFERIYKETAGVPRRINLLCDRLLLFGFLEDRHEIDGSVVSDVITDLRTEGIPVAEEDDEAAQEAKALEREKAAPSWSS
ncbi:MAG: XrtA/PEP-CTERM system-associated ATPase [Pseudomonadota bacterium]